MVIYESMAEAAEALPPEEQAWLYRAAVRFVEFGEEPEDLTLGQTLVFTSHRQALEKQRKKMADKETGKTELEKRRSERVNPYFKKGSTLKNQGPISKGPDRREEKRSEDKKREEKIYGTAKKRFVPPSVDEVAAYIEEKGYHFDAEQFVAHYESNDWHVGKNKMKSWKAACTTWEKNNFNSPNSQKTQSSAIDRWRDGEIYDEYANA